MSDVIMPPWHIDEGAELFDCSQEIAEHEQAELELVRNDLRVKHPRIAEMFAETREEVDSKLTRTDDKIDKYNVGWIALILIWIVMSAVWIYYAVTKTGWYFLMVLLCVIQLVLVCRDFATTQRELSFKMEIGRNYITGLTDYAEMIALLKAEELKTRDENVAAFFEMSDITCSSLVEHLK